VKEGERSAGLGRGDCRTGRTRCRPSWLWKSAQRCSSGVGGRERACSRSSRDDAMPVGSSRSTRLGATAESFTEPHAELLPCCTGQLLVWPRSAASSRSPRFGLVERRTVACAASLPRSCGSLAVPRRVRSHSPRSYRLRSSATLRATLRGNGDRAQVARASYGKRHNKERMGRDDKLRAGCVWTRPSTKTRGWESEVRGGEEGEARSSLEQVALRRLRLGEGRRAADRADAREPEPGADAVVVEAVRRRGREAVSAGSSLRSEEPRGGRTCAGTRAGRRRTGRP